QTSFRRQSLGFRGSTGSIAGAGNPCGCLRSWHAVWRLSAWPWHGVLSRVVFWPGAPAARPTPSNEGQAYGYRPHAHNQTCEPASSLAREWDRTAIGRHVWFAWATYYPNQIQ